MAGTTASGIPYPEATDTAKIYPALAQNAAEEIEDQLAAKGSLSGSVRAFANSGARATAIPTPAEGDMSSLADTDLVYRYSGSAWVAVGLPPGLNPIAPTSIANSGGSASTTLNTTTFTGVTSISLNGVFTATYDNYLILVKCSASTVSGLDLRLRVAGTDNTTSNYVRQRQLTYDTAVSGARTTDTLATISNIGTAINALRMEVMSPMLAEMTNFLSTGKSSESLASMFNAAACHNVSSAFDGITFLASSGNITGTITVYGYAK